MTLPRLAIALLLALALALPQRADAFVYWANSGAGTIGRANLDGTSPNQSFIAGAGEPCGVAVSGDYIYWANAGAGTISRAALDGSGADQSFIAGAGDPCGVAVSATHVYWANSGVPGNGVPGVPSSIGRANLDGTGANQGFIALDGRPCGVAVSADRIYWAQRDGELFSIGRASLDGTGAHEAFIPSAGFNPCGVAVSATHVHWANRGGGRIGRALLDGTAVESQFIEGASVPCGVAVSNAGIYWANGQTGTIGRANLDGTLPTQSLVAGASSPCGVALSPAPAAEPPPSSGPPPPGHLPEPTPQNPPAFLDADRDGVPDPVDRCPGVPGPTGGPPGTLDGCPPLGVPPSLSHTSGFAVERGARGTRVVLRVAFRGKRNCPLPTQVRLYRVVGSADLSAAPDPIRPRTALPDVLVATVPPGRVIFRVVDQASRTGVYYAFRPAAVDPLRGRCPARRSRLRRVRRPQLEARERPAPGPQPERRPAASAREPGR